MSGSRSRLQKVHLLLDDIWVVAADGDETPFHFLELHNSHLIPPWNLRK